MSPYRTLEWRGGALVLLDQRRLPHEVAYVTCRDPHQTAAAIQNMTVRGAPAIGAAAAYGLALAAFNSPAGSPDDLRADLAAAAQVLLAARPTAVNLKWALERVLRQAANLQTAETLAMRNAVLAEAHAIADEDVRANRQIGQNALPLLPDPVTFLHHCNTGALATVDYGTALGVIRAAHEAGRQVFVYVDETRPRLQGARLTAWELQQLGIPHQVIADGASGYVMKHCRVDAVTVGCDRVAANGDTANKIGTYNLAIVARAHGVPFYVAGPTSTVDLNTPSGDLIPIEERPAEELTRVGTEQLTPDGTGAFNPAFDVTPAEYIRAIITEAGVCTPPYTQSLRAAVARAAGGRP